MGTSYEPPIELKPGWSYNFCVQPVFVDLETGEWLGFGQTNCIEVSVPSSGEGGISPESAVLTLNGTVKLELTAYNNYFASSTRSCYVALISDRWDWQTNKETMTELVKEKLDFTNCASENDFKVCNYSLSVNASAVIDEWNNGGEISIYTYCAETENATFSWDKPVFYLGDPQDYSKWDNLWFDVRGNVLYVIRDNWEGHKETPLYENTTISNLDFVLRNSYFWWGWETPTEESYNETENFGSGSYEEIPSQPPEETSPSNGTADLSSADNWYFWGTYSPEGQGFLLGDTDGYTTGDSCHYQWYGDEFDYDYALSKVAFKPPFTFSFEAAIDPTKYGYHVFFLVCLPVNATSEMFDTSQCPSNAPFVDMMNSKVLMVGQRWEAYGQICANIGDKDFGNTSLPNSSCVTVDGSATFTFSVDENYHAVVYVNGQFLREGDIAGCESGYYLLLFKDFDGQIDYTWGTLTANEIKPVEALLKQFI